MVVRYDFEPKILGFLCNWCCYAGADLAGVSRYQYPTNIRIIRVMCSGRVDPAFILRAFSKGADGVLVGGCHLDDCHYVTEGNYRALDMVGLFHKLLVQVGLSPKRLRIEWVSASEGNRFAELVSDFTRQLKALGPLGIAEGKGPEQLRLDLEAAESYVRKKLISYYIAPDKCQACMICLRKCPAKAILGSKDQVHVIVQEKCLGCGICLQVCPHRFGAVRRILADPVPPSIPEKDRVVARPRT
ncbi:MAG: hydrogenase iron-sulfur subunit [Chloroflexi bacterium]|nr:hydrogenase iron-sulfur subunit [Chloroflexota bacterium]